MTSVFSKIRTITAYVRAIIMAALAGTPVLTSMEYNNV